MEAKIIEATEKSQFNWGKFMVCRFSPGEWVYRSQLPGSQLPGMDIKTPLLRQIGWDEGFIFVIDLQTGEGAMFRPSPLTPVSRDLNHHKVWVCPMYEPFLSWLYTQDLTDLQALPAFVDLGNVPTSMYGYRRAGAIPKK